MSPALNRSSAIRYFKGSDAIEIHDRITFNFYMGLPHIMITEKQPPVKDMSSSLGCVSQTASLRLTG